MTTTPYDVVVFGATSFVGRILAGYLLEEFGLRGKLSWAAAGRSQASGRSGSGCSTTTPGRWSTR
jgi:short subunit dehydrogenase-like uncharacterized protein